VRRLFGGWHDPVPALLAATPPDALSRLDIDDLGGPLPTFRRGRCVLLGDAAHAMAPDLGQGANQALDDAATLVRLTGTTDLDRALDEYDRLRRPRTQRIARRARALAGSRSRAVPRRCGCGTPPYGSPPTPPPDGSWPHCRTGAPGPELRTPAAGTAPRRRTR
jgi:FAD binding domain